MKSTLSTWISLAIMVMTLISAQAFMTSPSTRSFNPSVSMDLVVIDGKRSVPFPEPIDNIIIGPEGKPASSHQKDIELTVRIVKKLDDMAVIDGTNRGDSTTNDVPVPSGNETEDGNETEH